jgi:hypothetical protein
MRRELGEYAYGVLLIDAIAVILGGGLGSRHLGREMWLVGLGLAAYVTICFAVLIAGDLTFQWGIRWGSNRRGR